MSSRTITLIVIAVITLTLTSYVRITDAPHLHPVTPFTATALVTGVVYWLTRRKGGSS